MLTLLNLNNRFLSVGTSFQREKVAMTYIFKLTYIHMRYITHIARIALLGAISNKFNIIIIFIHNIK